MVSSDVHVLKENQEFIEKAAALQGFKSDHGFIEPCDRKERKKVNVKILTFEFSLLL